MERLLVDNADLFEALVKKFDPKTNPAKPVPASASPNPDIVVCARIRPLLDDEYASGFRPAIFPRPSQAGVVDLHELYNAPRGRPTLKSSNFRLDRAFGAGTTTEHIYDELVADLVPFAWNGGISTLFAYGQTGSGKTYTINRLEQLVLGALLGGGGGRPGRTALLTGTRKIHLSIIELAGNAAFDLLNARRPVSVLEDAFGVTQVAGAVEHLVATTTTTTTGDDDDGGLGEVMRLVEAAGAFRRTAATEKNDRSSRSHAICRVRVEDPGSPPSEDGLLYLVDLAGSEAARDRAGHGAERMRETLLINKSLSVLKDCIRGKAEADAVGLSSGGGKSRKTTMTTTTTTTKPYVPFRQSALTKMLKHVFDPASRRASKTVVVACVNPSNVDGVPSKNTLRFAEMLRVLMPAGKQAAYRPDAPTTWTNAQLRSWIDKNSGSPPISSSLLAPSEPGAQLLRLPDLEFEARCLKTPGVTVEQARAFRSKLWQLHVDSQHAPHEASPPPPKNAGESEAPDTILGHLNLTSRTSSRDPDPDPEAATVPFKERIRPGMVVRCTPPKWILGMQGAGTSCLVMVLSLASAAGSHSLDFEGKPVHVQGTSGDNGVVVETGDQTQYLCAIVMPGLLAETYEIEVWRHVVVSVEAMENEVILEYDAATRYYYMAI